MDLKQSARDLAIEYLLQEIKKGNLKAGDKLLNERKLSENLGISRVPLREAICTLSTLGILEAHPAGVCIILYMKSWIMR